MKSRAVSASRLPTAKQGTSFVSASLCVGVDGDPRPDVSARGLLPLLRRRLLFLTSDEAPDFVHLNQLARKLHERLTHVVRTGRAKFHQELGNRIPGNPGHAYRRTDRIALNQCANHLNLLGDRQLIHIYNYTTAHALVQVETLKIR
jgi:hypothetical protein